MDPNLPIDSIGTHFEKLRKLANIPSFKLDRAALDASKESWETIYWLLAKALMGLGTSPDNDKAILQARRFSEGRKKGQPKGALTNRLKAEERLRVIVIRLARDLWTRNPSRKRYAGNGSSNREPER